MLRLSATPKYITAYLLLRKCGTQMQLNDTRSHAMPQLKKCALLNIGEATLKMTFWMDNELYGGDKLLQERQAFDERACRMLQYF